LYENPNAMELIIGEKLQGFGKINEAYQHPSLELSLEVK
jgi:hypothetical protein